MLRLLPLPIAALGAAVWFGQHQFALGHFLWLKPSEDNIDAIVRFSDNPDKPGKKYLYGWAEDKVKVWSADQESDRTDVALAVQDLGEGDAQLLGPLQVTGPFVVAMSATYGVWDHGGKWPPALLTYHGHAYAGVVDEALLAAGRTDLQVVLLAQPRWESEQFVNVTVWALFKGEYVEAKVNILDGAGTLLSNQTVAGPTRLRLPSASAELWAWASFKDQVPGVYQEKNYTSVAHYATAYTSVAALGPSPLAPSSPTTSSPASLAQVRGALRGPAHVQASLGVDA